MQIRQTPEELEELRCYQRNSIRIPSIKATSILMLHKGFSVAQVSDSLGIDSSTLYRYCQTYKSGGISELIDNNKSYWGMLSGIQLSQVSNSNAGSIRMQNPSAFG